MKSKIFLLVASAIFLFLVMSNVSAAIAFDNSSYGLLTPADVSLTYSHTVAGSNTILFVGVSIESINDWVTGITYNGVPMARIQYRDGNGEGAYLYYLVNPASGTHNVVVSSSNPVVMRSASASYTGAGQVGQPDASTKKTTAVDNPVTTSLLTSADSSWMVSYAQSNGFVVTASTGTTLRNQTIDKYNAMGDSNAAITPPQSYSMSWSGGTVWNIVQASFFPVPGAVTINTTLISPANGSTLGISSSSSINFTASYNISTNAFNLSNATTYVWYSNGTLFNTSFRNITGQSNQTIMQMNNFNISNYLWNVNLCYQNSTFSNCTFALSNFTFQILPFTIGNPIYSNQTYQTKDETFILPIQANSGTSSFSGYLVYAGVNYPSTVSQNGNLYNLTNSIQIPANLQGNQTFYWNFTFTNSSGTFPQASSSFNQTVNNLSLYFCTAPQSNIALNFTILDAQTNTPLPGSFKGTFTYTLSSSSNMINFSYQNTSNLESNFLFCLNSSGLNLTYNTFIDFSAPNYLDRSYIIQSGMMGNYTQNISLLLDLTNSTAVVTFRLTDQNYNTLSGALIQVQKWNPGTNTYEDIGIFVTGNDGTGIMNLRQYDTWYRAIVTYNGQVVATTQNQQISSSTWNIVATLGVTNAYSIVSTINHSLSFDNSTNVTTYIFSDPNNIVYLGCIFVQNLTDTGYQTIYQNCLASSQGSLSYTLVGDGTYQIYGQTYFGSPYNISQITDVINVQLGIPPTTKTISPFGKVISFILIGTATLIGVSIGSPIVGLGLLVLTLFGASWLGWLNINQSVLIGFVVIVIIILARTSRRGY